MSKDDIHLAINLLPDCSRPQSAPLRGNLIAGPAIIIETNVDIRALPPAHGENLQPLDLIDLAAHQMI